MSTKSKLLFSARVIAIGVVVGVRPPEPICRADEPAGRRPNIIFLLTDDQGYGDLSCHGNPILKTPNLDRLHDEGVRFRDFYVSPTCSPTRSALMTGRHEFRNGVTHTILERERLTLQATTLAQVLKTAGYTTGIFGKWHLGDEPDHWPDKRGFDEMFIHGAGGIGQTYPGSCGDAPGNTYFDPAILHNGKFEKTRGYCTDVFFSQATNWIESAKGQRPFFCYIATNAPHEPLQVRPEDEQRYAGKVNDPNVARFFGMIANIDDNVGRLLAKLKEWDLERETLFIFMNDNGGTVGVKVHNAGMRGQKVTPWMGGTRASAFWRWPGTLKPADVDRLCGHIDFLPTLAEIAAAKLTDDVRRQIEGRSLVPLLRDPKADWRDRLLFTHVGRWPKGTSPQEYKYRGCAVRSPRWHLVSDGKDNKKAWQLFDVPSDPGEKLDIAERHPDVVRDLDAAYDQWWESVQPQLVNENVVGPSVNPFKELYEKQFGIPTDIPQGLKPQRLFRSRAERDSEIMLIRVGFEVALDFVKPSSVVLMPYIHPSQACAIRQSERLKVNPHVPVSEYTDVYGNRCGRAVVPGGCVTFRNDALVEDDGRPDVQVPNAYQHAVEELPNDVLLFLLASRYCEVDSELRDTAWTLFGALPAGWPLIEAVCNFVHRHIRFDYLQARANRTALDVYRERAGVCRDYMHLAITFCRSLNIPARYCTGYLGDIGVPPAASPMDFSAWFEVYLGGAWHAFDARNNTPRIGRVLMARGRDAADVALTTTFGTNQLRSFRVWTDEVT